MFDFDVGMAISIKWDRYKVSWLSTHEILTWLISITLLVNL